MLNAKHNPIFTRDKHDKTSDEYTFIDTTEVGGQLIKDGWNVRNTSIAGANKDNKGFQKHLIRFEHPELNFGDFAIDLILINSHNGTGAFKMALGIYRFVCANGLVAGKSFFEERIIHRGNVQEKIDSALEKVQIKAMQLKELIIKMQNTEISIDNQKKFINIVAKELLKNKLKTENDIVSCNTSQLLRLRRPEDIGDTVWKVFNVIQENALKGDLKYKVTTKKLITADFSIDTVRRNRTRPVKSAKRQYELNIFMFDKAVEFLKAA